jgi:putative ABC transport system permease protein
MFGVALKMLFGDTAKYVGLIFGIAFATLLISQQGGLFVGLMERTVSIIDDAQEADIWVMDPQTEYIDGARPLRDTALFRVRAAPGVLWAVPLFKANASVQTEDGRIETALLVGVDNKTLIGLPRRFVAGDAEALDRPDAVAIDRAGFGQIWPGEPIRTGRVLELNDRRAVIAAVIDASAPFASTPVVYSRYANAVQYVPSGRNQLTFVLARSEPGRDAAEVTEAITQQTGLRAHSRSDFRWVTISYYLANTGIPLSFGVVIVLGVVVGVIVVGLTFNMFISDNIKQYAALKALGVANGLLVRMVLLQATVVGAIGFSVGIGFAAAFFQFATRAAVDLRGFYLPWWVAAATLALVVLIMLLATFVGLRRVLVIDPAVVFRG